MMRAIRAAAATRLAAYLKRRRTWVILGCCLASSVLLAAFPGIDLRISSVFFDSGFYLADEGWTTLLHASVRGFLVVSTVSAVGIFAFNRFSGRHLLGIDAKKVTYLFLVLILGAGLIVNAALKDHMGRARPRDVAEFGGMEQFTPAFVIAKACDHNCSFSSGDSAGAFFSLALIMAAGRKRAVAVTGIGYGILVSVSRIAAGAHFFSDTVVSFFVMLIVSDALYDIMLAPSPAPGGHAALSASSLLARASMAPPVPP